MHSFSILDSLGSEEKRKLIKEKIDKQNQNPVPIFSNEFYIHTSDIAKELIDCSNHINKEFYKDALKKHAVLPFTFFNISKHNGIYYDVEECEKMESPIILSRMKEWKKSNISSDTWNKNEVELEEDLKKQNPLLKIYYEIKSLGIEVYPYIFEEFNNSYPPYIKPEIGIFEKSDKNIKIKGIGLASPNYFDPRQDAKDDSNIKLVKYLLDNNLLTQEQITQEYGKYSSRITDINKLDSYPRTNFTQKSILETNPGYLVQLPFGKK